MTQPLRRFLLGFLGVLFVLALCAPFGRAQDTPPPADTAPVQTAAPADAPGPGAEASPGGADPSRAGEAQAAPTPPKKVKLGGLRDGEMETTWGQRAQSLLGLAVLVGICFLMSNNRGAVSWRLVAWGVGLQITLGMFVLNTGVGHWLFKQVNTLFTALMKCTEKGSSFLFGNLALANNVPVGPGGPHGPVDASAGHMAEVGSYFAFNVLPTIIFFSALMAVLYHLGVMQLIVRGVAWCMQRTMGTSGSETLSASGNIFVGQTEAPLLVRPFVGKMTQSELMAVMTGGFATVAGGVMAAYVGFLQGYFTNIAGHLLSASVMSAPAALVCAKLIVPEPDPTKSETYGTLKANLEKIDANVIDAAARGAGEGLKLALNVGAMLLAFLALIALLNSMLGLAGGLVGIEGLSLEMILGKLLAPLAWLLGVPWEDAGHVGQLIGMKTAANEFVAYLNLAAMLGDDQIQHSRSVIIATYALCGFANFGSIAIQIGGISGIAPERRSDLAKLGMRAMIGGTIAALMTAAVAGLLI